MNLDSLIKREIKITVITMILLSITFFGVTYAIYMRIDEKNIGAIATGNLSMQMCTDDTCSDLSDLGNVIGGEMYPMSEEEGLTVSPYSFIIKNTGTVNLTVSVYGATYENTTVDTNNIMIGYMLSTDTEYTISDFTERVKVIQDNIVLAPNESKIIRVIIWGNEEMGNESIGGTFYAFMNAVGYYYPEDGSSLHETYVANIALGLSQVNDFTYTGNYQEWEAPTNGYYKVSVWGASGGSGNTDGVTNTSYGKGGYTEGILYLEQGEKLYIYVGGQGGNASTLTCETTEINTITNTGGLAGYNGGGKGGDDACSLSDPADDAGGGGGGATDIRFFKDATPTEAELTSNSNLGLNSRIMVAGGGGGSAYSDTFKAGNGGNLFGQNGQKDSSSTLLTVGKGGTQTSGYSFGRGANGIYTITSTFGDGGAGGGYYGASGHDTTNEYYTTGGGGSSYISGYAGVNSITSSTDRTHTDLTKHYSEKYFVDTKMESGVNIGNGKVSISYLSPISPLKTTTKLNNVRYIKDCINGSDENDFNHWVEIQAIKDGENIAKGKVATGITEDASHPISEITDGDITSSNYALGSVGTQCVMIDLGIVENLDEIVVWHYWEDGRTYKDAITSVSETNLEDWVTIINKNEAESVDGKRYNSFKETDTP